MAMQPTVSHADDPLAFELYAITAKLIDHTRDVLRPVPGGAALVPGTAFADALVDRYDARQKGAPEADNYMTSISDDKNYKLDFVIKREQLAAARVASVEDKFIESVQSVVFDEICGKGIDVQPTDPGIAMNWMWDEVSLSDLRTDVLQPTHFCFNTYGFCVVAIPKSPLDFMKKHARGDARFAFERPPAAPRGTRKARVRLSASDDRPLSQAAELGNEWICGAKVLDPTVLDCDYEVYTSLTSNPDYYILPTVVRQRNSQRSDSPISALLRDYRLVTYTTKRKGWRPYIGKLQTPVASLEPQRKILKVLQTWETSALAHNSKPKVFVELSAPMRDQAALTEAETAVVSRIRTRAPDDSVSEPVIQVDKDIGTHAVPQSMQVFAAQIETGQLWTERERPTQLDQRSVDARRAPGAVTLDNITIQDADALYHSAFDAPTTSRSALLDGMILLPTAARMSQYVPPASISKEVAQFKSTYRNEVLEIMGVRENALGASVVSNSFASTGTFSVTRATPTQKNGGGSSGSVGDAANAAEESALVHPSFLKQGREDLAAFFRFFYREVFYVVDNISYEIVLEQLERFEMVEAANLQWDIMANDIIERAQEKGNPELVEYLTELHKSAAEDQLAIASLVRRNLGFLKGLMSVLHHSLNVHDRVRLVFDVTSPSSSSSSSSSSDKAKKKTTEAKTEKKPKTAKKE
jgi:hypothetical protein